MGWIGGRDIFWDDSWEFSLDLDVEFFIVRIFCIVSDCWCLLFLEMIGVLLFGKEIIEREDLVIELGVSSVKFMFCDVKFVVCICIIW